jgi:hypothetical protein
VQGSAFDSVLFTGEKCLDTDAINADANITYAAMRYAVMQCAEDYCA